MNCKPKTVAVKKQLKVAALSIYESWTDCSKNYRGDSYVLFLSNQLKSDTLPLNKGSLELRICSWIEQNPSDWKDRWERILELLRNKDRFMHQGYKCLKPPTLAWLFSFNKNGDFNINRVLNQEFDWNAIKRHSDEDMH